MTSNKQNKASNNIPWINYEEPAPGARPNPIPFIEVAKDGEMAPILFIFEYRDTGEEDVGTDGNPAKIVDQIPHQYLDMEVLKKKLPSHIVDMVRGAYGLLPLKEAEKLGQERLDKVLNTVSAKTAGLAKSS